MSIARGPASTLHLQMGQEVIYLLLVTSLIGNLVLATLAFRSLKEARELGAARPYADAINENKRLQNERILLQGRIKQVQSDLDATRDVLKRAEAQQSQAVAGQRAAEERTKQLEATLAQAAARQQQSDDKSKMLESRLKEADARSSPYQRPSPNDQPPIINLREADGFSFEPGSAEVSANFLDLLRQKIVPDITTLSQRYHAQVVEVIGHTDGTSLRDTTRRTANLDDSLGLFLDPANPTQYLPYDNVGLGMARAVTVARALRAAGVPVTLDIQPLSASYLISPKDRAEPAARKTSDASRRRIEIRIRRIGAN